jgi:hypothetical protein
MIAICFLGGAQLVSIGILGEYLSRVFDEVRRRPNYIVRDVLRPSAGVGRARASARHLQTRRGEIACCRGCGGGRPQLVAVAYLVLALPLLPLHGVTYDAPALYYAGDRTLFFLTHPRVPEALNFALRRSPPGSSPSSPARTSGGPDALPVLPGLVAAVVSA